MRFQFHWVLALGLVGCQSSVDDVGPHGNDELGVVEFKVIESGSDFSIVGVGSDGASVAELSVTITTVTEADGANVGPGRSMRIWLHGSADKTYDRFGLEPLHFAAPIGSAMESFVLDPYVSEQLAQRGVISVKATSGAVDVTEAAYANGSCSANGSNQVPTCAAPSYNPSLPSTAAGKCCQKNTNGYGFGAQSATCNSSGNKMAERACFTTAPSCSSGKTYGASPVGCDFWNVTVCPGSSVATSVGSKWQCQVLYSVPECGSTFIGGNGCSVCSLTSFGAPDAYEMQYTAGSDTCAYADFTIPQINGIIDYSTMQNDSGHRNDYIEIYGQNFHATSNAVKVAGKTCVVNYNSTTQVNCRLDSTTPTGSNKSVVLTANNALPLVSYGYNITVY